MTKSHKRLNYKKLLRTIIVKDDIVRIFLVDGDYIRTFIDIEFIQGGHHHARPDLKKFIPDCEIYIEKNLNQHDRDGVIVHEVTEYELMKFRKMSYSKAHEIANKKEKAYRTKNY